MLTFPQIADAVSNLPVQSCFIDGEAIVVDECGLSVFDLLRYRRYAAILCAFDLIELDGDDLRPMPIEYRKRWLEGILRPARRSQTGITLNEHYEGEGAVIYRSSRLGHWLKIKNSMAPAVRREADEDWSRKREGR